MELAHTQNEGIISIKTGAQIRGILHYTQIMAPEKLKEEKDDTKPIVGEAFVKLHKGA